MIETNGAGLTGLDSTQAAFWSSFFNNAIADANPGDPVPGTIVSKSAGSTAVTVPRPDTSLPPSFTYGTPSNVAWKQVNEQEEGNIGDIIRIEYSLKFPWLQDWQKDWLVRSWDKDDRFDLLHVSVNEEKRQVIGEIRLVKKMSPVIVIAIAVAAIVVGISIWLSVRSISKAVVNVVPKGGAPAVFQSAGSAVQKSALSLGFLILIGAGAYAYFRYRK